MFSSSLRGVLSGALVYSYSPNTCMSLVARNWLPVWMFVCLSVLELWKTGDLSRIPTAWLVSSPWAHFDQRLETETNNSLSSYNLSFKGISLWTSGRSTSHLTLKDKSVCWLWNNLPEEIWFTSLASFISPKSHVYYILWIQESKILGLRFKD